MFKDSLFTFVAQVFGAVCGLILAVVTSRILLAEGRGIYAFLQSLIMIYTAVCAFGLSSSNTYYVASKKHSPETALGNSLIVCFFGMIFFSIFLLLLEIFYPPFFKGIDQVFVWIIMISLPFYMISSFISSILLGLQQFFRFNLISILTRAITTVASVVLLLIFPKIITAVYVLAAGGIINFLFTFYFFSIKNRIFIPKFSFRDVKQSVFFGIKSHIGDIFQTVNLRMGFFLLNSILNPVAVGIYSIISLFGTSLKFVPASLSTVLFSRVSAEKRENISEEITMRSSALSFVACFFTAIFLAIFAPLILSIFGKDFSAGIFALRISMIGFIMSSVSKVLSTYLIGKGFPQNYVVGSFWILVIDIAFGIFLIPFFGVTGMVVADTISAGVMTIIFFIYCKKLSPLFNIKDLLIPRKEDFVKIISLVRSIKFNKTLNENS